MYDSLSLKRILYIKTELDKRDYYLIVSSDTYGSWNGHQPKDERKATGKNMLLTLTLHATFSYIEINELYFSTKKRNAQKKNC